MIASLMVFYTDMWRKMRASYRGTKRRIESPGSCSMTWSVFGERWPWITRINTDPVREQKWALRNIKLRMSRKLLFISGLFMCISWALNKIEADDHRFMPQDLVVYLRNWTQRPPLELLATVVERYAPSLIGEIFDNYDLFLALLSDEKKRTLLENLEPDQAYKDDLFSRGSAGCCEIRRSSHQASFWF